MGYSAMEYILSLGIARSSLGLFGLFWLCPWLLRSTLTSEETYEEEKAKSGVSRTTVTSGKGGRDSASYEGASTATAGVKYG